MKSKVPCKKGQMNPWMLVGVVVALVAVFIALRVGVFTDATVKDAIPTDGLTATQNETLEDLEDNQSNSFKMVGVAAVLFVVFLIIAMLIKFGRG